MPRYFLEFVNLQREKEDQLRSILITIKLFTNTLPITTSRVSQYFYRDDGNNDGITYRKTIVTRIIAPEFIVQFGKPVRRNSNKDENGILVDFEEVQNAGVEYNEKLRGRRGLVCIASKDHNEKSIELFITFVPWGEYSELDGYVVVGECKEWNNLRKWMSNVQVESNLWETPSGDGVWINRCGRLMENNNTNTNNKSKNTGKIKSRKSTKSVKAVDLIFKKRGKL